jgi:predicted DNA-binding transcriptional regulator YafY
MALSVEMISDAVKDLELVKFSYRGFSRIVEPMCLGTSKDGVWKLRAHQVGGTSSSSRQFPDGTPRLFFLSEMLEVETLSEGFKIPPFYTRDDSAFTRIVAQL